MAAQNRNCGRREPQNAHALCSQCKQVYLQYIDVTNFVTNQYWTGDLSTAIEKGYCIATFKQVSDYYPVAHGGGKAELEDGMLVLLPASGTHYYSSPDKTNNPIPGIVFKEWKYGFGGVFVFFNKADLTLIY